MLHHQIFDRRSIRQESKGAIHFVQKAAGGGFLYEAAAGQADVAHRLSLQDRRGRTIRFD
jgi:hypothetical protein